MVTETPGQRLQDTLFCGSAAKANKGRACLTAEWLHNKWHFLGVRPSHKGLMSLRSQITTLAK